MMLLWWWWQVVGVPNLSRNSSWVELVVETSRGYLSDDELGMIFGCCWWWSTRLTSLDPTDAFGVLLSVEGGIMSFSFSTSESGLWVFGSMPLCLSFFFRQEFHRFLISLSVLPGNCAAIWDHLIKQKIYKTTIHRIEAQKSKVITVR